MILAVTAPKSGFNSLIKGPFVYKKIVYYLYNPFGYESK